MSELTIIRTIRPGLWLAEEAGHRVLVRNVPADRLDIYRRAASIPLPIPKILYAGPDAGESQYVIVEELLGPTAGGPDHTAWRTLRSLRSLLLGNPDRLSLVLTRAAESLAWLHAGGFLHGNLTPSTIWLHPRGSIRFAGLDCLQLGPGPAPCIGHSRSRPCPEQLEGWISTATDVRLLALALTDCYETDVGSDGRPPDSGTTRTDRNGAAQSLTRILAQMTSSTAEARPSLDAILRIVVLGATTEITSLSSR